ncbi:sensor histidine kinase [Bacillus sp. 37MA]|uniref:sensor histidine kinase n=1 Tax=Bacillus sp. 37MA TaxID=1132442 RepID=UPI0003670721|nr:sensor histidine kinase [Bacillus sp. 37MA]
MIKLFLKDRMSWIFFFILWIAAGDALILLDDGIVIETESLVYWNGFQLMLFFLFLTWRYIVEMAFFRSLMTMQTHEVRDWNEAVPEAHSGVEDIAREAILHASRSLQTQLSQLKAEQADHLDYVTSWVHEVKTPLTAMKLILEEKPELDDVLDQWIRIHALVDQQLHVARLAELQRDFMIKDVALQSMVVPEIQDLAKWCIEKNIEINLIGVDKIVTTDPKWCRFLIRQVLSNAVKYSLVDGTIHIEGVNNKDGQISLRITDEGRGINPADLPRVFEKGFTGDAGRKSNAATGLGLYLAAVVAEKLGHRIHIESKKGTTVTITYFPRNPFDEVTKM